jgi:hypothetical protein
VDPLVEMRAVCVDPLVEMRAVCVCVCVWPHECRFFLKRAAFGAKI